MKVKLTSDGFSGDGSITIKSAPKGLFQVHGEYAVEYHSPAELDKRLHKDIWERYTAISAREMAKTWLTHANKAEAKLQKSLDADEAEIAKLGKKLDKTALEDEVEKRQSKLSKAAEALFKSEVQDAIDAAAKKSHEVAMKAIMADAKAVLASKKSLTFRALTSFGKFGLNVFGSVIIGMGIGSAAGGPIGTAAGAAVGITFAIAATVVKGLVSLGSAASSASSLVKDAKGNYKAYNTSLDKLGKQLDETIALSRAMTSKWDTLNIRRAETQAMIDKIIGDVPVAGAKDPRVKKVMELQKKLEQDAKAVEKHSGFKPEAIEKALVEMRVMLKRDADPRQVEDGLDAANGWLDRVGQWRDGAENVFGAMAN